MNQSTLQLLSEIDKSITENIKNYRDHSSKLEFHPLGLVDEIERSAILDLKYPELYMFEISSNDKLNFSEWLAKFQPIWEDSRYKKSFTPNTRKRELAHIKTKT